MASSSTDIMSAPPPPPPLPPLRSHTETEAISQAALAKLGQSKAGFFARLAKKKPRKAEHADNESERALAPSGAEVAVDGGGNIVLGDGSEQSANALSVRSEPLPTGGRSGDQYAWATVYEHQRGVTLLSTRYYSAQTLLPWDPSPFTAPKAHARTEPHEMQSLREFVLPDPSWRWVSRAWMVDMRSDGTVQYDGFEYNWRFRDARWRPIVGFLSAGGWVRRRRWVRLMVRPADGPPEHAHSDKPSIIDSPARGDTPHHDSDDAWQGDDDDWRRISLVLKKSVRDGNKLELWRSWLGVRVERDKRKQWTEDDTVSPFEVEAQDTHEAVRRDWLINVLGEHGRDVLHHFIFPDSRAQFLDLVIRAGLREPLSDSGLFEGIDFYSRTPSAAPTYPAMPAISSTTTLAAAGRRPMSALGYEVHAEDKEEAEEVLDEIEIGRPGDGSNANALDKGVSSADQVRSQ